jgi:hypothetical protein
MDREKLRLLKDFLAENDENIEQLHSLGITEHASLGYVARVRDGQPRERALRGVLQGRTLTEEQKQRVGILLRQMSMPTLS